MTYYCANCWKEIERDLKVCPHCGARQEQLARETFVRKLVRALRHPEPETPIRAAFVLGQLKAEAAVPELTAVLRTSSDPYIAAACADALGRIGGPLALQSLRKTLKMTPSVIVEHAARKALEHQEDSAPAHE
jgi:HEAT repeat protein